MLTQEQLRLLKQIHAGDVGVDDIQAQTLLERGLIARQGQTFGLTPQGAKAIGVREAFGDAIVDAVLPGAGSQQAQEKR